LTAAACQAPPPPAPAAPAVSSATPLNDDGRGDGYEFRIRYPELAPEWAPLDRALHAFAAQRKQDLAARDNGDNGSTGAAPAVLDLEFNVARRTEDFVSALAQGSVHIGNGSEPIAASFVLHTGSATLLPIRDLFGDADKALAAISAECARQLEGRYEAALRQTGDDKTVEPALAKMRAGVAHGTEPTAENFAVWLVDGIDSKAIGLTVIFPQAQLGMTSGGEQQVEVPAKVFYDLLKPAYRDAFSVDVKELENGVR
jgi:hypothetical protein